MNEDMIERCAEAAHEMNRIYCESIGDASQPFWKDAPDWQKSSAMNGVSGALSGNTPEESHELWLKEKMELGWKFGPVKNPEKKEHPCMVLYAELPESQKKKDSIFINVVHIMAVAMGWKPFQ